MIQTVKIGRNSIRFLGDTLKLFSFQKILLVSGKRSYELSGAKSKLAPYLSRIEYFQFSNFDNNPKLEDVVNGASILKEHNCDLIIAVGGGSVIDMAKAIGFKAICNGDIVSNYNKRKKKIPLIAIPTTAGTGSEATQFAVVYKDGTKYSVSDSDILPNVAIVDSSLSDSNPPYLTACAGADALCQGFESMWASQATAESKEYARKSIELVWNNLKTAVLNNNILSKDKMSEGAFWAGKAINISRTTASHALSYKLTSLFNIPHGHAVALTIDQIMKINYSYAEKDIQNIISIINASNLSDAIIKLRELWNNIGLSLNLKDFGVLESDIPKLVNCNLERLKNNPAPLSSESIGKIFLDLTHSGK